MDPLEWTHQWDDYEMFMYVDTDGADEGIYMQVSQRARHQGAEEWSIIYNRKLAEVPSVDNPYEQGTSEWEDTMLRDFLHRNPNVVNAEKQYLKDFQSSQST